MQKKKRPAGMLCALVLLSTLLCGMLPASADDTAPLTEEWISAQLQSAETVEERIAPLFADGAPQPDTPWPELHVTAVYPEHSLRFFYADEDTLQAFYNLSGTIHDTYPVSGKAMWAVPFEADSAGQAMLGCISCVPAVPMARKFSVPNALRPTPPACSQCCRVRPHCSKH